MNWNPFTVATLTLTLTSFVLTILLLFFGKTKLHRIWGIYNLYVLIWGIGGFLAGNSKTPEMSLLWWRIAHVGVVTIPIFLYHATILFCNLKKNILLKIVYLQGIFFIALIPSNVFLAGIRFIYNQFYYPVLGPAYHPFFISWI